MEPFALSARYALECNISVLGTDNQPVGVVFGLRLASARGYRCGVRYFLVAYFIFLFVCACFVLAGRRVEFPRRNTWLILLNRLLLMFVLV